MGIQAVTYYSKAYATTEEYPVEEMQTNETDALFTAEEQYQLESGSADTFIDETAPAENGVSGHQLRDEIHQWGQDVYANHSIPQDLRNRIYEASQKLFLQLNSRPDGEPVPQAILDEYALLQTDYEQAVLAAQEQAEVQAESQDTFSRIEAIEQGFETLLSYPELEDAARAELEGLQKEIGKAKSSLELAQNLDEVGQLEASLEETLGRAEAAVEAGTQAHQEKVAALQEQLDQMAATVDAAHCSKKSKTKIQNRIIELKQQLEDGSIPLADIGKGVEEAQQDLDKAIKRQARKDSLKELPSFLPKDSYSTFVLPDSALLAEKIAKAIKSGDWDGVNHFLKKMTEDDDMFHYDSEIVIEQVIGAIFFGPANESKKELKKILDCIPEKTRKKMIDTLEMNPHDFRGWGVDDNEEQRRGNTIYGGKKKTINLLKDSLN